MSNALSTAPRHALKVLGKLIRVARIKHNHSQSNLAIRLHVTRQTIINIEKGSPHVAIGTIFEAAYILGIPLLSGESASLSQWESVLTNFSGLLPKKTRSLKRKTDNDF